jgi:two-component sensor histidine kinase
MPSTDRVHIEGPDLNVSGAATQTLVLLIHELWTNALKYGALSDDEGTVNLTWDIDGSDFVLNWVEKGPAAQLPEGRGFGRQLIEVLVPRQLNGVASSEGTPTGLRYQLRVPLSALAQQTDEMPAT